MPRKNPPFEAIIVGGGPAGLAAGIHLSRAGYRTLLLERNTLGGQAMRIEWVENYPGFPAGISGSDLMARWLAQARKWGLKTARHGVRTVARGAGSFKVVLSTGKIVRGRAILCCAGAEFKDLSLEGAAGFRGRGLHQAAFETAALFRRKTVAVVGGGEAAVHQALLLSRYARQVHLLSRGPALKAHRLLKSRMARRPNVIHVPNVTVAKLQGRRRLESLVLKDAPSGRRSVLPASDLFVLIGKKKSAFLDGSERRPGYFVAGDASGDACRQIVVAAGRGVEAAMNCIRYLEGWDNPSENN